MSEETKIIYRIVLPEIDTAIDKVQRLTAEIELQKQVKKEASKILLANPGDVVQIERQSAVIAQSEIALKKLNAEKRIAVKESDLLIKAAQKQGEAEVTSANASKLAAGSYNQLYTSFKSLEGLYRNTPGDSLFFDKIKQDVVDAKAKVDAFNRTLSSEGTLVGEYSSGVANAFKCLGIGDILKTDLSGGRVALEAMERKTNDLVIAYRKAQIEGSTDLNKLQKEIHDNVVETEGFRKSVLNAETQLHSMGGIGAQITGTIKENVKGLKNDVSQMLASYIGFQAAFSGVQKTINLNFDFEDAVNQLKAITGVGGKELEFLKQQALETSSKTKFSAIDILESFKLIASAKPELLQDVEALNQIKEAAVTLAQASGQSLPEAVDNLTKTLNQFGAPASDAAKYVDALAAGAKFGAAEVPAITSALLEFGTQAKSANISISESVGLIELLGEKGIQGAEAGTKLRNVLLALNAPDAAGKRALKELGEAGVNLKILSDSSIPLKDRLTELSKIQGDNTAIVKLFGKENFNAAQIVLQNIPRYAQLAEQVKATGIAEEQAADQVSSASTAWAELKNQVSNLVTSEKVTAFLKGTANALSFIIKLIFSIPFGVIVTGATLGAAAWAVYKGNVISATIAQSLNNDATLLGMLRKAAERLGLIENAAAKTANTIATQEMAVAEGEAAVATEALNVAVKASPLGIILGILALLVPLVTVFASDMGKAADKTSSLNKSTGSAVKEFDALGKNISNLERNIVPLLSRYDELKSKTNLSKTEQAELKSIIDQVAGAIPSAVTQFDQYGNAIAISTQRVREFIDTEKARLKVVNQSAIKETEDQLKKIDKQISDQQYLINQITKTGTFQITESIAVGVGGVSTATRKANQQEIAEAEKKFKDLLEMQKGYNAERKRLDGEALEEHIATAPNVGTGAGAATAGGTVTLESLKAQLGKVKLEIVDIDKIKNKTFEQLEKLKALRKDRDELIRQIKELGESTAKGAYSGAKLTGEQKDVQKELDAELDIYRAALEKAFIQRSDFARKFQTLKVKTNADGSTSVASTEENSINIANEQTYLNELLVLNNDYLDKKIAALKGNNAEEQKQRAEWNLQKIKNEKDTSQKLFDLTNKQIESALAARMSSAQTSLNLAEENPNLSNEARIKLHGQYLNTLLSNQIAFNEQQLTLEKQYGVASVENAQKRKDAIAKILNDLHTLEKQNPQAQLQDISDAADKQISQYNINYSKLRQAILSNDKLTDDQRKAQVERLDKLQNFTILSAQLAKLNIEVEAKKKLLAQDLINQATYNAAVEEQQKKKEEQEAARKLLGQTDLQLPSSATSQNALKQQLSKAFGFNDDSEKGRENEQLLGVVIAQSFSIAQEAMDGYFSAEETRVSQSKQLALDRIDAEKKQALFTAQSAAERASLEDQYAEKKKRIEHEAGERLKKVKKDEAKVTLATELANIAASAAANVLNGATFGAAGAIQYGIMSVLALARYAINIKNIDAATFAAGGRVKRLQNGIIREQQNVQALPNGDNILAYVKAGEVILNEKQQRLLGGAATFKAIGVPGFADGGLVYRPLDFGGFLGENLQAPVNPQSYLLNNNADFSEIKQMIADTSNSLRTLAAQTNGRIDKLRVVQVTRTVRDSIAKEVKNESIATL